MVAPALDIAAAIIGITAFSLEFFKTLREIQEKHSSEKNVQIEYISASLKAANLQLEDAYALSQSSSGALAADQTLLELARKCSATGAELDKEVDRLKQKSARKRDVFWATIKTMWREPEIQKLYTSFKELQETLDSVILTRLAYVTHFHSISRMKGAEADMNEQYHCSRSLCGAYSA